MGQRPGPFLARPLGPLVLLLLLAAGPSLAWGIELNTEETLRSAVKRNPRDPAARHKLVRWHLQWGELRKAIDELQSATGQDPANAWQYHEALGDIYSRWARDDGAAASQYKDALALNPLARRSMLQYGQLRLWQGRREEAETLFREGVASGLLTDTRQRPLELSRPVSALAGSTPWYHISGVGPLSSALERLAASTQNITTEYLKWKRTRAKDSEADVEGAADPWAKGGWRHFWIHRPRFEKGIWRDSCSYKTPKTCKLLETLNGTGAAGQKLVILQADFDVLEPNGRIRPHCHANDRETWLLLPLLVPRTGPGKLPSLKVGNEERFWAEGSVALFDATFEHEEVAADLREAGEPGHDYASELHRLYHELGVPKKVDDIPGVLSKWAGKEEKMVREVRKKYLPGWKGERAALRLLVRRSVLKAAVPDREATTQESMGEAAPRGRGEL